MQQTGKQLRGAGLNFRRRTFHGNSRWGWWCELPVHAV